MSDFIEAVGPFVILVAILVMYVVVVQLTNDFACSVMDRSAVSSTGDWLIKFLALCWW